MSAQNMPGPEYDPNATPMREAAVRCSLRIKRLGDSLLNVALLNDVTGEIEFKGPRYPEAWEFMRQRCGLRAKAKATGCAA